MQIATENLNAAMISAPCLHCGGLSSCLEYRFVRQAARCTVALKQINDYKIKASCLFFREHVLYTVQHNMCEVQNERTMHFVQICSKAEYVQHRLILKQNNKIKSKFLKYKP